MGRTKNNECQQEGFDTLQIAIFLDESRAQGTIAEEQPEWQEKKIRDLEDGRTVEV
ncbi:MAG: hypothetical protein Q9160_003167 [Pyrenula sp. 1 TL-2023]